MRSQWRQWPDKVERSWPVPGGTGHVVFPLSGDQVEHDDGTLSPREFTYAEIPDDRQLPHFVIECAHAPGEPRPRVVAVHVIPSDPSREVQATDLRRLRFEDAIAEAFRRASRRPSIAREDAATAIDILLPDGTPLEVKRTARGLRSRARRKITDAVLDETARVYRENLATGRPTQAVRDHFGLADSTASLYVKRAREAGRHMGDQPASPRPNN